VVVVTITVMLSPLSHWEQQSLVMCCAWSSKSNAYGRIVVHYCDDSNGENGIGFVPANFLLY
jgi:hypothetical protein